MRTLRPNVRTRIARRKRQHRRIIKVRRMRAVDNKRYIRFVRKLANSRQIAAQPKIIWIYDKHGSRVFVFFQRRPHRLHACNARVIARLRWQINRPDVKHHNCIGDACVHAPRKYHFLSAKKRQHRKHPGSRAACRIMHLLSADKLRMKLLRARDCAAGRKKVVCSRQLGDVIAQHIAAKIIGVALVSGHTKPRFTFGAKRIYRVHNRR